LKAGAATCALGLLADRRGCLAGHVDSDTTLNGDATTAAVITGGRLRGSSAGDADHHGRADKPTIELRSHGPS
jgi:hypothetical protein